MTTRERLSWDKDKEKKAETEKKADPYTMNQSHPNPPVSKYDTGGPSEFAEDPDMKTPWKTEGRLETGHPAPAARQAVKAARQLEDKALKCITVAQRMLPGATDELIEDQATDLMYIPENRIMATLQRQAKFAEVLAGKDSDSDYNEDEAKSPENEGKEPSEKKPAEKKSEEEPAEKKEEESAEKKSEEKPAEKKAEEKPAEKKAEEKPAEKKAENGNGDEEENGNGDEEKKKKEDEKEASEENPAPAPAPAPASDEIDLNPGSDLLDSIFANEETEKTGAKKLSGIVKKASTDVTLDNLWSAPPDISEAFPSGKV